MICSRCEKEAVCKVKGKIPLCLRHFIEFLSGIEGKVLREQLKTGGVT